MWPRVLARAHKRTHGTIVPTHQPTHQRLHACRPRSALEGQPSEEPPLPFSYLNEGGRVAQADRLITCHKTYTNSETHRVVIDNKHTLPAYESGEGKGAGPRYCPSLFSKVERFPERQGHMVWLEPEGIDSNFVYPSESQ